VELLLSEVSLCKLDHHHVDQEHSGNDQEGELRKDSCS